MAYYNWALPQDGVWTDAADWTPSGVPNAFYDAAFATAGGTYTVGGNGEAAALSIDSDHLTVTGTLAIRDEDGGGSGLAVIDGASLTIAPGAFVTAAEADFDAGTFLEVHGALTLDPGGGTIDRAEISGPQAGVVVDGGAEFNQLTIDQGGTLVGAIILEDGGDIALDTSATLGSQNQLFIAGNGSLSVARAVGQASGSLTLSDYIDLNAGGLTLATDPGAVLDIDDTISGAGYLAIGSGSISLAADNTFTGGIVVGAASLTLVGPGAAGTGPVFLDASMLMTRADASGLGGPATVVAGGATDTVTAAAGALTIFADAAALTFQGGADSSTVVGGTGALSATGGTGGDLIYGGTSGADTLTTGPSATTLVGGLGGKLYAIGGGTDVLVASSGNTTLNGGESTGNDTYFAAKSGNTVIDAGAGASTIVAGAGAATIYGGTGPDDIFLGTGTTRLDFIDGFNGPTSDVVGFEAGDTLHLSGYGADEAQSALASAVVASGNTVLTLSDNTQIVLFGFTGLSAASFT